MTEISPEQERALGLRFAVARERSGTTPLRVLGIGEELGRWAAHFQSAGDKFSGAAGSGAISHSVALPDERFDVLGTDLVLPYDDGSFDLVFSANVVQRIAGSERKLLLSEAWRVARPGGELVFMEDFVVEWKTLESPVSVSEFERLLLEATVGEVVLTHVESFKYPGEDMFRGGLISVLRLGGSENKTGA